MNKISPAIRRSVLATLATFLTAAGGFVPLDARAQYREEGAPAQGLGLADAVRSAATGPTALYFNPAGMHQQMHYAIEAGYQYSQPFDSHVVSASIVDSATNEHIAAGFGYAFVTGNEVGSETSRTGHMIRGGLASGYRFGEASIHLGLGIRWMTFDIGDTASADGFTMDAGALVVYNNLLRIGIVGHNLIKTELSEAPRRMGIGVSVYTQGLLVGFDTVLDFETLDSTQAKYNVGLEYTIAGMVPLRIGYTNDQIFNGRQLITAGIGYLSRIVAVDFAFGQSLTDENDNLFTFNARFFIP